MGAEQMTKAQSQVVEIRGKNILVAAAAGSGKTWVLIKRIISRMQKEHLKVTSFLLVTFTKAAAAEMRERLSMAIHEQLMKEEKKEQPLKELLAFWREQETLVYQAPISTIDSFCSDIVKQYFMKIDVDPNYRIADEGELFILKNEVLDKLIERQYVNLEEDFITLLECYAPGRSDAKIGELILGLYDFQMSHPNPDAWIAQSESMLKDGSLWYEMILSHAKEIVASAIQRQKLVTDYVACEVDGIDAKALDKIKNVLAEDYNLLLQLFESIDGGIQGVEQNQEIMERLYFVLQQFSFPTLRFPKDISNSDKEWIKGHRDYYKKLIVELKNHYFQIPVAILEKDRQEVYPIMHKLLLLSQEFRKAYEKQKRQKNIADFSDVEHMALHILTRLDENGVFLPSEIALQLREEYAEIMIDEYQDSNYLQETILSSIAQNNMFMVGDMKQSIYRFRMARPDLFVGKYQSFATYEDGRPEDSVKVELDQNFRSSANVLESINSIFYRIMRRQIGAVEYDRAASLKPGADYPIPLKEQFQADNISFEECIYDNQTELLIFDTEQDKEVDKIEAEARMIACRIQQMLSPGSHMMVKVKEDRETGKVWYRPAKYRDIVVLLRSPSATAAVFSKVFEDYGIPAFVERSRGYFSATEVELMLNYLRVLNNGRNDIAMTAVLHNYFGQISSEEMAFVICEIRDFCEKQVSGIEAMDTRENRFWDTDTIYGKMGCWLSLYQGGLLCYDDQRTQVDVASLAYRLEHFITQYEHFQKMALERSVGELIQYIYKESGYWRYVSSLPAGELRCANLDMLFQRANDYEKTHFRGLFQFVRYIEQLHQYEVDYGEANLLSEEDDVVRIMSIHKSKGLEFPIVFVSQMAKQFNEMDLRSDILLHEDYGLGPNYIDATLRIRRKTVMRMALALDSKKAMLGEELRVLYVALTRAKDKCIMTGCVESLDEAIKKLPSIPDYAGIYMAHSYLQWVLMALVSYEKLAGVLLQAGYWTTRGVEALLADQAAFSFYCYKEADICDMMTLHKVEGYLDYEELKEKAALVPDEQVEALHMRLTSGYSYEKATTQVGKYSVSQLKTAYLEEVQQLQHVTNQEKVFRKREHIIPEFMKGDSKVALKLTGALRGTYIHKFMELYDFSRGAEEVEYKRVMAELEKRNMKGLSETFGFDVVQHFFDSPVAQEMVCANREGRLYKEAQFVVGFPADEVLGEENVVGLLGETLLIQGIIDAYYEVEDGSLVIIDYKTDNIEDIKELRERYTVQMEYYKKTLEQITGKTVSRVILYSFHKHQEICIN